MADDLGCAGAEAWLVEWAGWVRAAPLSTIAGELPENRTARSSGLRPETPRGDGGMVRHYLSMQEREAMDRRARQIHALVHEMPPAMRQLVEVTYLAPCAHDTLPRRAAALKLGINETSYRILKAQVIGWIAGRLNTQAHRRAGNFA